MKTNAFYSKLISLSKEILINYKDRKDLLDNYWHIIEWISHSHLILSLVNPNGIKDNPLIGKKWAITKKGYGEVIDLTKMLIDKNPTLEFGDFRNSCEFIIKQLQDTAYIENYYDLDKIRNNVACRLFDTILPDPVSWAAKISVQIHNQLSKETENVLLLFSLPCNIESQSFHLGYYGLRIINITEDSVIQELNARYVINNFSADYFNRWTNEIIRDSLETKIFLAIERKYNKNIFYEYAKELTDIFLSVLIVFHAKEHQNNISPSAKETKSTVIKCFEKGSRSSQTTRFVDNPLFYSATKILISPEILLKIRKWWSDFDPLSPEKQSKIKNGLSFYISGLLGNEISQFSNLYLFLDSVYGENGRVENAIKEGILKKLPDYPLPLLNDFWKIRCDILHGGINRLFKWKNFSKFLKTYSTDPVLMLNRLCNDLICNGIY